MDSEERLTISKALVIAEECFEDAKRAREAGEPDGEERFQEWSATLFALRTMKERGVPERLRDEEEGLCRQKVLSRGGIETARPCFGKRFEK